MNGVGLNLQGKCWNVHLFDPAPSKDAQFLAIGRSYRLGSKHDVLVIEYFVQGSFNERVVNVQILRSLPGLMAMIDQTKLIGEFGIDPSAQNGSEDASIDAKKLEGFYVIDGQLVHKDQPEYSDAILPTMEPLKPQEVLIKFFQLRRGRRYVQHGGIGEAFTQPALPTESNAEAAEGDAASTPKKRKKRASVKKRKGKEQTVEQVDSDVDGSEIGGVSMTGGGETTAGQGADKDGDMPMAEG